MHDFWLDADNRLIDKHSIFKQSDYLSTDCRTQNPLDDREVNIHVTENFAPESILRI